MEEKETYKLVIYDRFCDDVRCFDCIEHNGKQIKNCALNYNEDAQWWEFNVYYEDGSEEVVKDKLIQFISECVYIAD